MKLTDIINGLKRKAAPVALAVGIVLGACTNYDKEFPEDKRADTHSSSESPSHDYETTNTQLVLPSFKGCIDTDGGPNLEVAGITQEENGDPKFDYCKGDQLMEFVCNSDDEVIALGEDCIAAGFDACLEGRCWSEEKPEPTETPVKECMDGNLTVSAELYDRCLDRDRGFDSYQSGKGVFVRNGDGELEFIADSCSGKNVMERACVYDQATGKMRVGTLLMDCTKTGSNACFDGACAGGYGNFVQPTSCYNHGISTDLTSESIKFQDFGCVVLADTTICEDDAFVTIPGCPDAYAVPKPIRRDCPTGYSCIAGTGACSLD